MRHVWPRRSRLPIRPILPDPQSATSGPLAPLPSASATKHRQARTEPAQDTPAPPPRPSEDRAAATVVRRSRYRKAPRLMAACPRRARASMWIAWQRMCPSPTGVRPVECIAPLPIRSVQPAPIRHSRVLAAIWSARGRSTKGPFRWPWRFDQGERRCFCSGPEHRRTAKPAPIREGAPQRHQRGSSLRTDFQAATNECPAGRIAIPCRCGEGLPPLPLVSCFPTAPPRAPLARIARPAGKGSGFRAVALGLTKTVHISPRSANETDSMPPITM